MKHILAPILLLVFLFPPLALSEEVTLDDLIETDGLYYKKFTEIPFSGNVTGREQGSFKDGVFGYPFFSQISFNLSSTAREQPDTEDRKSVV